MYDVCKAATWAGVEVGVCSIECVLYIMCVSTAATCAGVEVGVCETPFHQVVLHSATNEGKGTDLYICIQDLGKIEECAPVTGAVLGAVPCLLSPSRLCPGSEVQECHGEQKEGVARFSLV
jgi:hypothetical protein